jgi:hypothetical protein
MVSLKDKSIKEHRDPDFVGAEIAMDRAAKGARRRAAEIGGTVAVFKNGKIVHEYPVKETSA